MEDENEPTETQEVEEPVEMETEKGEEENKAEEEEDEKPSEDETVDQQAVSDNVEEGLAEVLPPEEEKPEDAVAQSAQLPEPESEPEVETEAQPSEHSYQKSLPADPPSPPTSAQHSMRSSFRMPEPQRYEASSRSSSGGCDYVEFHLNQQAPLDALSDSESGVSDISKMDIGERLYYAGCGAEQKKQAFVKQERESKVLNELSQLSQPKITRKGREQPPRGDEFRSAGVSGMWKERLEMVRQKRKELEEESIKMQTTGVPMGSNSKRIVEQNMARKYHGPISGWEVHRDRHLKKQYPAADPFDTFVPNINREKNLGSYKGEVFSRLHTDAVKRTVPTGETTPKQTNTITFISQTEKDRRERASVSPSVKGDATPDFVVHRLLSAGQAKERRRAKVSAEFSEAAERKYSYHPSLNEKSLELAAERRKRKAQERASPSIHTTVSLSKVSQPCSPTKPKTSATHETRKMMDNDFLMRNNKQVVHRMELAKSNEREKVSRELEHCTFYPRLNPNSEALLAERSQGTGREYIASFKTETSSPSPGIRMRDTTPQDTVVPPPNLAASPFDRTAESYATTLNKGVFEREIDAVLDEWNKIQDL
eukprot:TRINITY_DN6027_c0_g1_i2.p1 TRINITY_DN6027_c0_g1~~TRINITY_DN6027_c0_g1_i2.p1  ORF type:complete len:597 (+),score=188.50 TRINITY_DN6027_c0_g1_i2:248-2038(+)